MLFRSAVKMLPKNQVLAARKAVEALYTGSCTVTRQQKYTRGNKSTGFKEVVVLDGQPCRLSYSSAPETKGTDSATDVTQAIKILLAPEVQIEPGSRVTVIQNGVTETYKSSGKPAVYQTHQEIRLELCEGKA